MTPRQGCFAGFFALVELALSNHANIVGVEWLAGAPRMLEKFEGYAKPILKGFHFGPHDAFIVISTSGIRPVIVEMALGAKKRGMPVIGVVSRQHCEQSVPAHSSGKKLTDVADVILDNQCPPGDCVVEMEGLEWRTGSDLDRDGRNDHQHAAVRYSGENAGLRGKAGFAAEPPIIGNTGAEEQLERFYKPYRTSLRHLYE